MRLKYFFKLNTYFSELLLRKQRFESHDTMRNFIQKFNPITGSNEWVVQPENYDFLQEIARSSYGDMLHDTERNHKYFLAIQNAIAKVKKDGRPAKVLDIGTGTGLLSMMAAVCGADTIYACEAFLPVAKCANNVVRDNELDQKITIIPKRSTELTIGEGADLPEKANILVTEVFDTELIGEGALNTFKHALSELLEENCVVVPSSATIYVQIIESELISNFNKLKPYVLDEHDAILPHPEMNECDGAAAVHDVQVSEIQQTSFKAIADPFSVFHFDFTGKCPLKLSNQNTKTVTAKQSGCCEAVFMWWQLQMDETIILSCAPTWRNPTPLEMEWRDHWMQAVYYFPKSISVREGGQIQLHAHHDEYSLWFGVSSLDDSTSVISHPVCTCMFHCSNSRTRIGMLNDPIRRSKYMNIFKNFLGCSPSTCLSLGDGNVFALIAPSLGIKVFLLEQNSVQRNMIKSLAKYNSKEIQFLNVPMEDLTLCDFGDKRIDILFAEPHFMTGLLPWDSLFHFWYKRSILDKFLSEDIQISPEKASLMAVAVEFKDLWKLRAPVGEAEGFSLYSFDQMTQEAIAICDNPVEPHALWEYPCKPLSNVIELMSFDITRCVGSEVVEASGTTDFVCDGRCNGVAIWVEYKTGDTTVTTGPTESVVVGKKIIWDMYTRQGVYFIQPFATITFVDNVNLLYRTTFDPLAMNVSFEFEVQHV